MPKKTALWLVLVVLIIATFFRLHQFKSLPPGLYPDEAMNGNNALEAIQTGDYKLYYPENNGREGLFMNIQSLSLRAFGVNEPWALRFPSTLFGILTVLGLYFLGRELFSKKAGLIAAFFLATSFWHINFSRIGFRAITASFFLIWGLYFLLRALREGSNEARSMKREASDLGFRIWCFAVLGGLSFGLGFHSYIAYRVSPLLLLLFLPFFRKYPNFWKIVFLFAAAAFLAALPIGLYYLGHPGDFFGRTSDISIFDLPNPLAELLKNIALTAGMFFFRGDGNWRHNLPTMPELYWPVAILFAAGIAFGLRALVRKQSGAETGGPPRFGHLLLFAWLGLAVLPVVISNEGLPHALRAIVMLPPVMLLAGYGGALAWDFLARRSRRLAIGVGALIALILIVNAYVSYFILWGKSGHAAGAFNAEYVEIGRKINALPPGTDAYVVVERGGVDVRGLPVSAQTTMFITDTFLPENRARKRVHYLRPDEQHLIPEGGSVFYIR